MIETPLRSTLSANGTRRLKLDAVSKTAHIVTGSNGWVYGMIPAAGDAAVLLGRMPEAMAPVRVAEGPVLLAEMPYETDAAGAVRTVESALELGSHAILNGGAPAIYNDDPEAVSAAFVSCLEDSGVTYERNEHQFQFRLETGAFQQKITAEPRGSNILLRGDLARWKEVEPDSAGALAHFLLSLNRRIRLARGSVAGGRVGVEVVLPASTLRPWLLEKALGALAVAARLARRECAALLDAEIARNYLEFHKGKEKQQ